MRVALTGATGFIGRFIASDLAGQGHSLRCWHRPTSQRDGFDEISDLEWIAGDLGDQESAEALVSGCDAVIHAALFRPGKGFRGAEGDLIEFVQQNVVGTLELIEASRRANVGRFIFVSTCAVHEQVLDDRPLDEAHPLWATSHYGAHKAAIEKFVHSYGFGDGFPICALRPTGVYGVAHPPERSKWFELVQKVVSGASVDCRRGGKEVHAADVARAARLLLDAPADAIRGQAFNCYDQYISEWDVAHLAREVSASNSSIEGGQTVPRHQIETGKLRSLGMVFGGRALLRETIAALVGSVQSSP